MRICVAVIRLRDPRGLDRYIVIGALQFDITGAALDPLAAYGITFGTPLTAGQRVLIGRLAIGDQRSALVLTAFGHEDNGRIIVDACPASLSFCLAGFGTPSTGSGQVYAVFTVPTGAAIATGIVADSTGPRNGIAVHSDTTPVVSVSDPAGRFGLPALLNITSTLSASDPAQDLHGSISVTPTLADQIITADIELLPTAPSVIQIDPPNHASNVALGGTITVTFSEAIAAATVTSASAQLHRVSGAGGQVSGGGEETVSVRRSLSSDGKQLTITPNNPLSASALYRLALSTAITDRAGTPLTPNTQHPTPNTFSSDFTTAAQFTAASLPPNTLRVSLPDTNGKILVCGGPQLALPGTLVDVINDASTLTVTTTATDAGGTSGSAVCDNLFPTRCNTSQPGGFCAVLDGALGNKILVQVEDVFGNLVTLAAGNMRDERTGATAVGPDGGRVVAVDDPRYSAQVPAAAFDTVRVVTVVPIANADFPVVLPLSAGLTRAGGVFLDLGDNDVVSAQEIDLTIPAPVGFDPSVRPHQQRAPVGLRLRDEYRGGSKNTGAVDPDSRHRHQYPFSDNAAGDSVGRMIRRRLAR